MSSQKNLPEIFWKKRYDKWTDKQTNRQTNRQTNYFGQFRVEIQATLASGKY